jgi:hypothetical protein
MDVEALTYLAWEERKLQKYLTLLDEMTATMSRSSYPASPKKRLSANVEADLLAEHAIVVHVGRLPMSTSNLKVTWV